MDTPVLGGGVVVLVAVLLWLVYLLPSWRGRAQYHAAQRNAVRLSQALRVLAETSETPDEVRVELNTRDAFEKQRLARQVRAEQDAARSQAARTQRDAARVVARADLHAAQAAAQADAARAQARAAQARERSRADQAAAHAVPAVRRMRARRRTRLVATLVFAAGSGLAIWGPVQGASAGVHPALWVGIGLAVVGAAVLLVASRVRTAPAAAVDEAPPESARREDHGIQDLDMTDERSWTPRRLPQPLTVAAGSRAAAVLDQIAERDALRRAAVDEAARARAARNAPRSLDAARRERAASAPPAADDAAIEAHVRRLLARRAAGM